MEAVTAAVGSALPVEIIPLAEPEPAAAGSRLVWLACGAEGHPVGVAQLRLPTAEGREHRADLDVRVHPVERRRGVGARLLAAAVTGARHQGRRTVVACADQGSAGDTFLAARGFCRALTLIHVRLPLATVDTDALIAAVGRPHPGYRLLSFDGVVPDELAETFAASHRAMDDMPRGDLDHGTTSWDVPRVRAAAGAVERRGDLLHTVVAVAESDGGIAGFTELVVPGDGEGDAQHYGTGVLPEHRGHGLGHWMKAEAIRQARERHPLLAGLLTDTADTNVPMRAINDALGYEETHRVAHRQLRLDAR